MDRFANKLLKDYPRLFKHKNDKMQSLMCFGIDCGKGWHKLIHNLTRQLDEIRKGRKLKDLEAVQIKEKFGGLRYYIQGGNQEAYDLISKAEEESYHICEKCGKPGKLRTKGWYYTLCNSCQKKKETNPGWRI